VNHKLLRWLLLTIIITGIVTTLLYQDRFDVQVLNHWVTQAGIAAPLLFILVYALATVLFLPGSVLTLAGGALFGPLPGTLYNLTGATIGAAIAFMVARYLASDWVEKKAAGRLQQLKQGIEKEGWHFVAFVRLVPLFPFNLLNYALGLTRLKLSHYIVASYIFMLPGAFAYTYLGYAGREAIAGGESVIQKGLLALSLLAAVAFLPRLISRFRHSKRITVERLKQLLDTDTDMLLLDVRNNKDFNDRPGHIAGAINLPLEEIEQHMEELSAHKDKRIAIICTTDRRSLKSYRQLLSRGFSRVEIVSGGMAQWKQYNYPTEHN
jgi:uncharacterized membrane protein YdjX (TVP38/TMEM64 family)